MNVHKYLLISQDMKWPLNSLWYYDILIFIMHQNSACGWLYNVSTLVVILKLQYNLSDVQQFYWTSDLHNICSSASKNTNKMYELYDGCRIHMDYFYKNSGLLADNFVPPPQLWCSPDVSIGMWTQRFVGTYLHP